MSDVPRNFYFMVCKCWNVTTESQISCFMRGAGHEYGENIPIIIFKNALNFDN